MNGFSAADMSPAAANGHAEGYQAGYADALKEADHIGDANKMVGAAPVVDARLANWIIAAVGDIPYSTMTSGQVIDALRTTRHVYEGSDGCGTYYKGDSTPAAPGIELEPFRLLVEACEAEFTGAETEELEPDDSKVSYPEDRCHITFGMIRNARKALDASPKAVNTAAPGIDPTKCLQHTHAVIDKMQDVMTVHGFTVPVRVISDAFRTTLLCQQDGLIDASPKGGSDERARFEAWAKSRSYSVDSYGQQYVEPVTRKIWSAWQAAMQATSHGAGVSG